MMQTLIPKLIMEITKYDDTYHVPTAQTNISLSLLSRPEALITTPIGFKNSVPAKKLSTGTEMDSAVVQTKANGGPSVRRPRVPDAEQVGIMSFKDVDDYKHFLRVGKHIVHSSPCVQIKNINWGHCLTYEEWSPTRGAVDGIKISVHGSPVHSSWECRCRRRRKPRAKKKATVRPVQREPKQDPTQGGVPVAYIIAFVHSGGNSRVEQGNKLQVCDDTHLSSQTSCEHHA